MKTFTQVKLVSPSLMPKLGKAGSLQSRQAIVHSLVHTESWAIDLSWVLFLSLISLCFAEHFLLGVIANCFCYNPENHSFGRSYRGLCIRRSCMKEDFTH